MFQRVLDGGFGVELFGFLAEDLGFGDGFGLLLGGLFDLDVVLLFAVGEVLVMEEVLDLEGFSFDLKFGLGLVGMQLVVAL